MNQTPNTNPYNAPPRHIIMDAVDGEVHGNDWSRWYSCGDVIDEFVITVYGNDVLVQFAPLNSPQLPTPAIKRRVGESGRDKQKRKGIGLVRVKSLVAGANGTFDLELYS